MQTFDCDMRIVMTLDADGTSLRFSAMRDNRQVTSTVTLPTSGGELEACLTDIVDGFKMVMAGCPARPAAISFAFPGSADCSNRIMAQKRKLTGGWLVSGLNFHALPCGVSQTRKPTLFYPSTFKSMGQQ